MFNRSPDSTYKEAIVLAVDIRRGVCKCRTREGHFLSNVQWARPLGLAQENGESYSPLPGEVVVLTEVGGEPLILFSKTVLTSKDATTRARISPYFEGDETVNRYDLGVIGSSNRMEGASPDYILPGDRVQTNDRGSILGILRSGSVLAKAGPLAQIFLTRMDDLVRVVSRNLELFSDSFLQVSANVKGKLYTFRGYFKGTKASRAEEPEYYEVLGNVAVGLTGRGEPLTADVSATSDELKREVVSQYVDGIEETPRFLHTLHEGGKSLRKSANADETETVVETVENNSFNLTVTDAGGNSFVFVQPAKVTLDSRGTTLVELDGDTNKVTVHADTEIVLGAPTVTVNSTTATVNTTTLNANTTTTNVTASTATITCPATTHIGAVTVQGLLTAYGLSVIGGLGPGPVAQITGAVSLDGIMTGVLGSDFVVTTPAGDVSLKDHVHTSSTPGNPTSPPVP